MLHMLCLHGFTNNSERIDARFPYQHIAFQHPRLAINRWGFSWVCSETAHHRHSVFVRAVEELHAPLLIFIELWLLFHQILFPSRPLLFPVHEPHIQQIAYFGGRPAPQVLRAPRAAVPGAWAATARVSGRFFVHAIFDFACTFHVTRLTPMIQILEIHRN